MTQQGTVLVLAEVDDTERVALEAACSAAGFAPAVEPSAETAISKLTAKRFDALIVHLATPGAALACMRARGKLLRSRIPVIALVEDEDEGAFGRAYRAGADEVLLTSRLEWLTSRLAALPKPGLPQPGNARGDAVVADADRTRAEVLERVLRDAGFRVEIAVDGFSTRLQAGRPSLKVAVIDASLDDVAQLVSQARSKGARCAWIVRARPEQLKELRDKLSNVERVSVVNAYGPPDDVLFETNRLLEQKETDGRSDPRLLHGSIVKLAWGNGKSDIGYSYNVSSVGLYVRTLVGPASDKVDIEATPPGAEAVARLHCKVVWRREFGATRKEPVPAGFGLQIVGGDAVAWAEACPRVQSVRTSLLPVRPPEVADATATPLAIPGVFPAITRRLTPAFGTPQPEPPPRPAPVVPLAEPRPRGEQSSVERMLASVLSETESEDEAVGSSPLRIEGDNVVDFPDGKPAVETLSEADLTSLPPGAVTSVPPAPSPSVPSVAPEVPDEHEKPTVVPASASEPPLEFRETVAPSAPGDITPAALGFDLSDDASHAAPAAPSTGEGEPRAESPLVVGPLVVTTPDAASTESSGTPLAFRETAIAQLPVVAASAGAPSTEPRRARAPVSSPTSSAPSEDYAIPKRGGSKVTWIVAAVVLGGIGVLVAGRSTREPPPAAPEQVAPQQVAAQQVAPADTTAAPTPTAATEPAPSAAPTAEALVQAPAPVTGEAPSAPAIPPPETPAPGGAAAPGSAEEPDSAALATLQHGYGFLYVASPLATNVYAYGLLAGTTNQRIVSKCGPRFLRLGTAPGVWQGEGGVQIVKCGGFTRIEMTGQ